tara:strand:+ start:15427 stop:16236 length:810 start_codon:yes stop_codon:yes gene_type:complete
MAYLQTPLSETQTWRNQDERRYNLERRVAENVLEQLGKNLPVMVYKDAPPTTLVATLYFDTADGYYLQRARDGAGQSSVKVRAREYLPVTDDQERTVLGHSDFCYLERKERLGTVRQKYRIKIAKEELGPIIAHKVDLPLECDLLRTEVRERDLRPAVISMYERRVWGRDDDLRVTLDERIRYYRPASHPFEAATALSPAQLGPPGALGPKRILEVKHFAQKPLPEWLATLLSQLPEATGFSKFLDGMAKLENGRRSSASLTRPVYKLP